MDKKLFTERKKLLRAIENLMETPMIFLGFVWLVLIISDLVWGLPQALQTLSLVIWGIFILDFIISFLVAPEKTRFLRSQWLTALSLVLPAFRLFRLVRMLRILRGVRLVRIIGSLNRGMRSLGATMKRRGFGYVVMLVVVVTLGGAAGMFALETGNAGFESYSRSLWWTSMRVITAGSEFWPATPEGRILGFILAVFGYAVFGYVTATIASYFIGRDAEEADAPVAGSTEIREIHRKIQAILQALEKTEVENPDNNFTPPTGS